MVLGCLGGHVQYLKGLLPTLARHHILFDYKPQNFLMEKILESKNWNKNVQVKGYNGMPTVVKETFHLALNQN